MRNNKRNKIKIKCDLRYNIFYFVAFVSIVAISLLSNSFFAYDIFNSLFFNILYLILSIALFVVRSIQTFLRQTALYGKIFSLSYFNMFALVFAIRPFVTSRQWSALLFGSFIVAIILLVILAFKHKKAPHNYRIERIDPMVAIIPLLLLLMFSMIKSYIGAERMWIPIVLIGVTLAAVALYVLLKYFRNIEYFKKSQSEFIFSIILIIVACFYVSGIAVTTINYAFDHTPSVADFEIIDKRIQSGTRRATSFYLKVLIDGQEKEIDVPVAIYHLKEIGDTIEIKLYKGALGYGYYVYE